MNLLCKHRVILVDQWTPLGAFVRCLDCGKEFHTDRTVLENYVGFEHTSDKGPTEDRWVFILTTSVEGKWSKQ